MLHPGPLLNLFQSELQEGPYRYGIESDPALVYYEKEVPAVFEGDLDVTDSGIFSSSKCYETWKNPLSDIIYLNILCWRMFKTKPTKLKNYLLSSDWLVDGAPDSGQHWGGDRGNAGRGEFIQSDKKVNKSTNLIEE